MDNENPPVSQDDARASPSKILKRRVGKETDKNSRKKARCETLHLASSDVRMGYPQLFASIFNGCPKEDATIKFRAALSEDCVIISRSLNNPYGPNYREIRGVDSMVEFFDALVEAVPDLVFQVLDTKFYKKPPSESMIVSSYTMTGRIIYTIDTLDTADVEDIDSAISGLQMLYQSGGSKTDEVHPIGKASTNNANNSSTTTVLARYSSGTDPVTNANGAFAPVERFDFSTKFSPTGVSLYALNGDEEDDLEVGGVDPFVMNVAGRAVGASTSSCGRAGSGGFASHDSSHLNSEKDDDGEEDDEDDRSQMTEVHPYDETTHTLQDEAAAVSPLPPAPLPPVLVEGANTFINGLSKVFLDTIDSKINSELQAAAASAPISNSFAAEGGSSTSVSPPAVPMRTTSQNSGSSSSNLVKKEFGGKNNSINNSSSSFADLANMSALPMSAMSKEAFWLKHKSNVMIVKEHAKFCLKEKVPEHRRAYKIKGTMTLYVNADKRVTKVDLFHNFDTAAHNK